MSDSEEDADLERQVKISLVGEPSTGKSMLCARYLGLQWGGLTQGADVLLGECPPHRLGRPPVPLKLCDVAGSARDSPMLANYIYASHVILLVYDISSLQSFERLGQWLENVSEILTGSEPVPILAIFGNKCDIEHQRAVNSTIITLVSHVLGVPVNKSLFVNSTIIKAELAFSRHHGKERKITNSTHNISTQNINTDKESDENLKKKKKISKKERRKAMKELKWKATSAVCTLQ